MNLLISVLVLIYIEWYVWKYPPRQMFTRFIDFRIYYHAAQRDFTWIPEAYDRTSSFMGWIYPRWTRVFWIPFTWIEEEESARLWHVLQLFALAFILHTFSGVEYGWIIILATAKPLATTIWCGNVTIFLLASCFIPWGAALGIVFKPYLAGIFLLDVFAPQVQDWIRATAGG